MVPLTALGLLQLLEPKVPALASRRGRIGCIVLKLVLGYLVIGYTGAIESHFWLVLLLPVVTAAATFGLLGTLLVVVVANGFYLSFLLYINWTQMTVEGQDLSELVARVAFVAMAGILANSLAEDLRVQSEKHRRTAEHLSEANRQVMLAHEAVRRSDKLAALGQLTQLAHARLPWHHQGVGGNVDQRCSRTKWREVAGFISMKWVVPILLCAISNSAPA
jgi:K+-sensing histidine kinase KdpD